MKSHLKRTGFAALWIVGGLGFFYGAVQLRSASKAVEDLYGFAETTGTQIERDIEYCAHESYRAFAYSLTVNDPNAQLPYVDESRTADAQVTQAMAMLASRQLAPELRRRLESFNQSWQKWGRTRDEIVALILVGDQTGAGKVDESRGQPAFEASIHDLHRLKVGLEEQAALQSRRVNSILRNCVIGLGGFVSAVLLICVALLRANSGRQTALNSLAQTNTALRNARELEMKRAAILEMVGAHAPLTRILANVAELASGTATGLGVGIWAGDKTELHFKVAAQLPEEVVNVLAQISYPFTSSSRNPAGWETAKNIVKQFGFSAFDPIELHNASGRVIGAFQCFMRENGKARPDDQRLTQMAHLAAIAIENRFLYERLAFQAQHDTLTELPNRLLFQDRLDQAIRHAHREANKVAVIWMDVDRFKQVNDLLGHRVGDALLCKLARRFEAALRESDTVARIGGDEFIILLSGIDSVSDAQTALGRITNSISQPMSVEGHEVSVSASAGISLYPDHGEDPGALMRNADLAMYSAKRSGRNTSQIFASQLGTTMLRRVEIERELTNALDRCEFSVEYQPLVRREGQLDGLEALLRWKSSTLGQVPPTEFIPIAEDMGIMGAVGEWITRTACRDGANWMRSGHILPRIAVNVSAVQFRDKQFASMVRKALHDSGLPPNKLEIEVTETVLINSLEHVIEQIDALRRLGVRFAIDDFGTGYSSLNQLRSLPVDCVKIDRSFVKDLENAESSCSALVRGIVELAHSLHLEVVAEGVETKEQLALLRKFGCDVSQGFLLFRPMSSEAVQTILPCSPKEDLDRFFEPSMASGPT